MFEAIHSSDERGQVGIGTLIVFIAMVLVAAIAAGVLINTAGSLQSQASNTGSETQQAVANQVEVVHAVGNVTQSDDHIDRINMTIKQSAGSEAIDIGSMTVQYTSDSTDQTLVYRASDTTYDDATEGDFATNPDAASHDEIDHVAGDAAAGKAMGLYAADSQHFTTFSVNNGPDFLTDTEERLTLSINTTALESPSALDDGLEPGSSATIKLVDQSGAQYTYGIAVPATFGEKTVVEV